MSDMTNMHSKNPPNNYVHNNPLAAPVKNDSSSRIINEATDLTESESKRLATKRWHESQKAIREMEKALDARVIVFYFVSSLSNLDIDYIHKHVASIGRQKKIAVWLRGPGGAGTAALRIVFMLRQYCDELIFIIPSLAASACTMMALGGNKILMGPASMLSPIDASIANHPLAPKDMDGYPVSVEVTEIQKFVDLVNGTLAHERVDSAYNSPYGLLAQHVHPVFIGAIQRSLSESKLLTTDILKTHMSDEGKINHIVSQLNDTFPEHGYPITFKKAQELGIQVEGMDDTLQTIAAEELEYMQQITALKSTEQEGGRTDYTVDVVFETHDWRTVYIVEQQYSMTDGKWEKTTKKAEYAAYKSVKTDNGEQRIELAD